MSAGTLSLSADGDGFSTESQTAVFDTAGSFVGGGCATAIGTRLELNP